MKTLCFGSLNIDNVYHVSHFVTRGETLAADALNIFSGGKGLNQSVSLARAGLEVFHAGAIGSDGQFLLDELKKAGVDCRYTAVLDDTRTGHAIIQKGPDGDNCILLFGGANQQITREQIDQTLSNFGEGDLLVLQNEISELSYLVDKAGSLKMRIALNPSPMSDSLIPLFSKVDYLILNEVEAAQFLQADPSADPETLLCGLLQKIPQTTVILTLGKEGAVYAKGSQIIHQKAIPVQAVDTTAAGDTFTGFLLAGLLTENDPIWAIKYASAAAAISVTRLGAAPSIPSRDDVLQFLKEE